MKSSSAPTVVLAHGWNAELHYLYGFPILARGLNRRGLNAVIFELPFHLRRRPRSGESMTDFISYNLSGMLLATKQALADIETLVYWAKLCGSPAVATWGFSLGGWLAGLHLTQSQHLDAAALTTPISDLAAAVQTLPFCYPIREALETAAAPLERLNLVVHKPAIPSEKIMVTESLYDVFVPGESYPKLADAWFLNGWHRVPQSHVSILTSRRELAFIMDWIARTLNKHAENKM